MMKYIKNGVIDRWAEIEFIMTTLMNHFTQIISVIYKLEELSMTSVEFCYFVIYELQHAPDSLKFLITNRNVNQLVDRYTVIPRFRHIFFFKIRYEETKCRIVCVQCSDRSPSCNISHFCKISNSFMNECNVIQSSLLGITLIQM